jgi:F-type H+-transporting ATPase subunit delta
MALVQKSIARRYARAMIDLAREQGVLVEVARDLSELASLIRTHAEFRHALVSPSYPPEQRRAVLEKVADGPGDHAVHPLTRTLLELLSDKDRVSYIPLVADAFRAEADRLAGLIRAEVHAAAPLSADDLAQLTDALRHQARSRGLGQEVAVTARVDPTLLAGVKACVGGLLFDGTLKSHLRRMGAQLTQRA